MYKSLNPGMVGIGVGFAEAIELAGKHGFGGLDVGIRQIAELVEAEGAESIRSRFAAAGVRPGSCSLLPGTLSAPYDQWAAGAADLPRLAGIAEALGYTRAGIVMLPFHETLDFDANSALHVERLRQVGCILADHGISLGIEYVSQETRRAGYENPFLHDLAGTLALCEAAGGHNLGVLLDAFHWYCAGETLDDVAALRPEQVVLVHVSDAPAGRSLDEHVAFERALPGETGVIDLAGFGRTLRGIGYDGPVTCEPFVKLADLSPDAAAAKVSAALDAVIG